VSEKRRGLGRGLGALIPTNTAPVTRPGGDRPVDVFFPGREGEEEAGEAPGSPGAAPSNLTVLPGGRLVPVTPPPGAPFHTPSTTNPPSTTAPFPGPGAPAVGGPRIEGPAALLRHTDASRHPAQAARHGAPASADQAPAGKQAGAPVLPAQGPSEGLVPVPGATFAELPVGSIRPNPKQPRQVFDEEELGELVHSIKEVGVLQPVVVRRVADADAGARYELIMGERRLRAARDAGLERIPAIVRDTQDDALLRDALLENLHRSQLNPLEEAAAYQQLLDDFGCTHEDLATRIGRSRPQISNTLRLLKLPALVQRRVAAGVLSAGHARALLGLEDQAAMERLAQRIVAEGISVRAVEEIVALGDGPVAKTSKRRPRAGAHTSELDELAARLGDRLDTRVSVALGRNKGRLSIDFASVDDLNRIIALLGPEVRGVFDHR
jgi:ParB family transcriptional regulator, chromosome partitioning protein